MKKSPHKFQEKMMLEMTYEQDFRNRCQEMICLARELEQLLGRKKTLEVMGKAREKYVVESTKKRKEVIRDFEDFKAREKAENASYHTWTLTYPEETPDKLVFHVTECLWTDVYKEAKAADLGYALLCQPDFAYAQACHPKIKMKRTKTLMQGDSYCDHTFYWEE